MRVSFLELYNEELFDLLGSTDDPLRLRIYEDSAKKVGGFMSFVWCSYRCTVLSFFNTKQSFEWNCCSQQKCKSPLAPNALWVLWSWGEEVGEGLCVKMFSHWACWQLSSAC